MTKMHLTGGVALGGAILALAWIGRGPARATPASGPLPAPMGAAARSVRTGPDTVVFSGGCFWGVQAVFEHVRGVLSATSGYAGGALDDASYPQVSTGTTGNAESVRVVFDPSAVSFGDLLQIFFSVVHDPTELNRQGPDVGTQYRSAIWYTSGAQRDAARAYIAQLTKGNVFSRPIVTQVNPLAGFVPAETYHQDYFINHPDQPYIVINDKPKVRHLKSEFPKLWREDPVRWEASTGATR